MVPTCGLPYRGGGLLHGKGTDAGNKKMGNSGRMTSNGEPFFGSIPHALSFLPFSSFMALARPSMVRENMRSGKMSRIILRLVMPSQ